MMPADLVAELLTLMSQDSGPGCCQGHSDDWDQVKDGLKKLHVVLSGGVGGIQTLGHVLSPEQQAAYFGWEVPE